MRRRVRSALVLLSVVGVIVLSQTTIGSDCHDECQRRHDADSQACERTYWEDYSKCWDEYYNCVNQLGWDNPQCDYNRDMCLWEMENNYYHCRVYADGDYAACLEGCPD